MQIIDGHQHFWRFDPIRDNWITESMQQIQRDFLPEDLEPILNENSVEGCVAVQAVQSVTENDFLLKFAGQFDFIKGIVGWVDLQDDRVEEQLKYYSNYKKLKGFRHVLQGEQNRKLMLEPDFKRGIGLLSKYGFTYDLLIFSDQLSYAAELAAMFPGQRFVLDHVAKPGIKSGEINQWTSGIKQLAINKNVWCKASGLATEADWQNWKQKDFEPYLDVVFDAFGVDRLMFGSDWPVCNLAGGYAEIRMIMENYLISFSEAERSSFWSQNAIKFYNL